MGAYPLWVFWFVAAGIAGLSIGVLTLDGVQQVTTGRPGFLPFERLLYKRVPATDADCIRRGAAELLQALGATFISGPALLLGLVATGNLTGAMAHPAYTYPSLVRFALFAGYAAAAGLSLFCAGAAYNISTKIKYVPTSTGAQRTPS